MQTKWLLWFIFVILGALIAQNTNTYLGPKQPPTKKLIRILILVNDDPNLKDMQIVEAQFNQTSIPLKPRDIYGFRGQASFQLPPGKYRLKWKVQKDASAWPRTISHEEEVVLDPRDLWIQVAITGEQATIS